MICTVAMVVINMAVAQTSFAHGEKFCVQEQVRLVNFLAVQRDQRRAVHAKKIRNMKIRGLGQ
jgi:hypothetical protein